MQMMCAGTLALAKYTDGKWYCAEVTRDLGYQLVIVSCDFEVGMVHPLQRVDCQSPYVVNFLFNLYYSTFCYR